MNAAFLEADLEQLAVRRLEELGWETSYGPDVAPGEAQAERSDYRETTLRARMIAAVSRLNPELPPDAVASAVSLALRPESQVLSSENWRAYELLVSGVPVEYRDSQGVSRHARARLIDTDDSGNNDYCAINQFTVVGTSERRPDIVCFVNGLPLAVLELKRPGEENATLRGAYNQVATYRRHVPELFTWNQVVIISDGVQARASTYGASWEHFAPWKTVDGAELADPGLPQLEVLIEGLLPPQRLLDVARNFIAFSDEAGTVVKKMAKYHQYWAVKKAVAATAGAVQQGHGRAGVVWHTQGSGKSLEMLFYAGIVMRDPRLRNPTIVVLTDRNDLDDQLFEETFLASRPLAPLPERPVQAESRADLKRLLAARQSGGIIFSTLQKFGRGQDEKAAGAPFPVLSERRNIVVVADEAHRSQYDFVDGFARHLRDALPNAAFLGFTGTPIESADKSTRQVFGDYIDVYDLTQAVEDGATVKVFYEPRLARLELPERARGLIDASFAEAVSGAEEEVAERLKSRWARVEAIVGSDTRLRELARDIVSHWEQRRAVLAGKAMIVTMSRRIAVALYDELVKLHPDWHSDDDTTGVVKVVITGTATDSEAIQRHVRSKEGNRAVKSRAKDPRDELEVVIVRDMWLTGFDSPSMHTMYVDKPMRGAPLMQAIARVNRTFKDKPSGLVVDYIGIADDLKAALAEYTKRDQQNVELGEDLRAAAVTKMLERHEVVCTILHGHPWRDERASGRDDAFLRALSSTVNWLVGQHPGQPPTACSQEAPCLKCRFLREFKALKALFATCIPVDEARALTDDVAFFDAVRGSIAKIEGPDREGGDANAELDAAVKQVVSEAVAGAGVIDIYAEAGLERPDLSLIDADFIERFKNSDRQNLQIEMLKRLLNDEIRNVGKRKVVAARQFSEMLIGSILRYQNRTLDAAQVVAELVNLAQHLRLEAGRGAQLGLTEDELAFYDAIRANERAVLDLGDDTLKTIAHELVVIVRRDAKTDWDKKEQVRAKLRATIRRLLLRHGYPPDSEQAATQLVLRQAEVIAAA